MDVRELPAGSFTTGELAHGCDICAQGQKMVLLVTGQCESGCFYCPLSLEKRGRDVTFANEMLVREDRDIIEEARAIDALGSSLTGGDPLIVPDRSIGYIKMLKKAFGPEHHIHLYTATPADGETLKKLAEAGLDSIRFHPDPRTWKSLELEMVEAIKSSKGAGMTVGVEVPVLPDMKGELAALLRQLDALGIDYANLNELEYSEGNWRELKERGYEVVDDVSSAVRGSRDVAFEIADELELSYTLHFCSSSFKDAIQLRNRIRRRAENTRTPLDIVSEDGTFIRGVIETDEPETVAALLESDYNVPAELFWTEGGRVVVAAWVLEEISRQLDLPCFIVEEYPTADRLEVERRRID